MVYSIGDKVITKKKHPCGNDVWTIVRVGADYKIRCDKCGRVVMLSSSEFLKSVRQKVEQDG
ncbi:MAG TPA: DUF951 domain-containing protein [Candidatus Borkfalkia faecipullorum]|uniref:DUF951 domain-containing protein n=1 Tax=Candidatus Borkfalkia faecipullorum TaxID=2838510 RepID=A0A9D1V8E2_9FIRM|nr:DUF951 domain-containing protein [Candidatus Borkfalkia faecipullorum]